MSIANDSDLIHFPVDFETQSWYNMVHGIDQEHVPSVCCVVSEGKNIRDMGGIIATTIDDVTCSFCWDLLENDWLWDLDEMDEILEKRFNRKMFNLIETENRRYEFPFEGER